MTFLALKGELGPSAARSKAAMRCASLTGGKRHLSGYYREFIETKRGQVGYAVRSGIRPPLKPKAFPAARGAISTMSSHGVVRQPTSFSRHIPSYRFSLLGCEVYAIAIKTASFRIPDLPACCRTGA
jgi:hypothetical protein